MSYQGPPVRSGECPECGRDIGLQPGPDGDVLRYHKDVDGDGGSCPGRGKPPKPPAPDDGETS